MGVNHAAPNIFKFSSEDRRERENAYKHTLKTIETAERVKAPLVVLHMGAIDMKDYMDKLEKMVKDGKKDTPKYQKLFDEVVEKREEKKERYVQAAYDMLGKLIPEAEKHGIKLGIENREAVDEIPLDSDYPMFFKQFTSPSVVYWHDTGHAQIKENLGFIDHLFHLHSLADRLYGFHVHDVQFPGRDHCPPGSGMIDFKAINSVVKPEHLKVFEFNPGVTVDQVKQGIVHIKALWGPE